jgi:NAD(P)H-hydrate epimerase
MAAKYNSIIILKGAFTQVVCPSGDVYINSTGNPGMATGGSGDVLTGIIAGLLAQGYTPVQAGIVGVYIHGLAADIAVRKVGQASMVPSDLISSLGEVFIRLEQ